jgi:hypothetical protein
VADELAHLGFPSLDGLYSDVCQCLLSEPGDHGLALTLFVVVGMEAPVTVWFEVSPVSA